MKKLLIVESPAKIKTINKFLGKDFVILSTVGHIKDLPAKELGVSFDENENIVLKYQTVESKEKVINDIVKQAQKADEIYLAPDPDREGEIIAWHVYNEITEKTKNKKIHRIEFNEITEQAVLAAIKNPHHINENLVAAQQARRVLDRWVGYQISPVLWRKIARGLSAGRVQSVALKLICIRENNIKSFKAEEYWSIDGDFSLNGHKLSAELIKIGSKKAELSNEQEAKKVVLATASLAWIIEGIKDSTRSRKPTAPFITSTIQQAAYNQLGFSVQQTMQLAQKLYEGIPLKDESPTALITYMRTDSTRISDTALTAVRSYIKKNHGTDYLPAKAQLYAKKTEGAQDAHEAIRPVDIQITPESIAPYMDKKLHALYELIWRRFVACQMTPAVYAQRQITIIDNKKEFTFRASGSVLTFNGFLAVYDDKEDEEDKKLLPPTFEANTAVILEKIDPKQHFTQPPARYTEATLVKELEKEGIGRPSTYATILKTIQARDYTQLDEKKRFIPTDLGSRVISVLEDYFTKIFDVSFTAQMEKDLDRIESGELQRDKLLKTFYEDFSTTLSAFIDKKIDKTIEVTTLPCSNEGCDGTLIVKIGKSGQFLGCNKFPTCSYTSGFERTESGEIIKIEHVQKFLDEKCPLCESLLQERKGRFGLFTSCSGYPKCTYIKQNKTVADCPGCKEGKLVKKFWKKGTFWSCEKYPTCKYSISGDIVEKACPLCDSPFLKKNSKTEELNCANQNCTYKESDSENIN